MNATNTATPNIERLLLDLARHMETAETTDPVLAKIFKARAKMLRWIDERGLGHDFEFVEHPIVGTLVIEATFDREMRTFLVGSLEKPGGFLSTLLKYLYEIWDLEQKTGGTPLLPEEYRLPDDLTVVDGVYVRASKVDIQRPSLEPEVIVRPPLDEEQTNGPV